MSQPSLVDGGNCPEDRFGVLQRAVLSANVDGAVVSIEDRPHACEILEIGVVEGTRDASVGMAVRKRGRTTELTYGEVISIDYTTTIPYGDGLGSVTLVDQVRIAVTAPSTSFGTNGDSGSVVVDEDRNVVGLYFAGNASGTRGVANPIAKVLSELDVEMCTGPKLLKEFTKEIFKELKPEFKEWLKWEKPEKEKFEKEKPEKLEKEKPEKLEFEVGGGKLPLEKGQRMEKDPHIEKGPLFEKDARSEKSLVREKNAPSEKGLDQPKPVEANAGPGTPLGPGGPGWGDPFAPPMKNFFDKPFPEIKAPKEGLKDKQEWKEFKPEQKEHKELKDHKESKDAKDKEWMFEGPPGGVVAQAGVGTGHQAAAPGQAYHFIPSHLRPDLGRGALRNEPG